MTETSSASLDAAPGAAPSALVEGMLFAGRYRIVRRIAAGQMGAVYEVLHVETDRRRALKVMHPHVLQSDELRERFRLEARVAAQVESEHIVDVSDAGVDEASQTPFLVMELLHGEDLESRVTRLGPLPAAEVVTYVRQIALALDKTHARLVVHRDLKPANVFLTLRDDGSPRVKILDFGIAKLVGEGATAAGATRAVGTPLYMAPEQFRLSSKLGPPTDIHALGMMTYTLLAGEPYWTAEARGAGDVIAFAMVAAQGPRQSAVGRAAARGVALPPGFDAWFARATAVNPADRFPRASDAACALKAIFGPGNRTIALPTPSLPPPGRAPETARGALERASTSSGAALDSRQADRPRHRRPLLAGAALVGLSGVATGGWLAVRAVLEPPTVSPPQTSPVIATAPEVPVTGAASEAVRAGPTVEPAVPAPATPAGPAGTPPGTKSTAAPAAKPPSGRPGPAKVANPSTVPAANPSTAPAAEPGPAKAPTTTGGFGQD